MWGFAAPLLLAAMVGTIAAAVNELASPPGGLQIAGPNRDGFGDRLIRMGADAYPRKCFDADDFRVEIARPPRRIVSQSRAIEEFLYLIAPGESIVGVSAAAYEQSTSDVYSYVDRYHPAIASDLERVLRLNPDLIVVSSSGRADFASLVRSTGVPVYRMYTMFTTLDEVAEGIRLTGYLTGHDEAARTQERAFRAELEKAFAMRPASAQKPRVAAISNGIAYGRDTLFNDIVDKLGGINVAAEGGLKGYEEVNSEMVLKWNPEWIVTGADPGKAEEVRARLLADPAIALTKAARNDQIVVFDNRVFLPVSPYSVKLVSGMAQALYGDAHKTGGGA